MPLVVGDGPVLAGHEDTSAGDRMAFLHWILVGHLGVNPDTEEPTVKRPLTADELRSVVSQIPRASIRGGDLYIDEVKASAISPFLCMKYNEPAVMPTNIEIALSLIASCGCVAVERDSGSLVSEEELRELLER